MNLGYLSFFKSEDNNIMFGEMVKSQSDGL